MDPYSFSSDNYDFDPSGMISFGTDDNDLDATVKGPSEPAPEKPEPKPRARKAPKARASKEEASGGGAAMAWLKDRRVPLFAGIVLLLVTGYLLLATFSYFRNVVHDQNIVVNNSLGTLASKTSDVANIGGPLGAWVSDHLISQWLGLGAIVLTVWLGLCSLALLGVRRMRFWSVTFRCFLLAVALSIVAGFITYNANMPFYWGGYHGYLFNREALALAGLPGAIAVSVVAAALVALVFGRDLMRLWSFIRLHAGRLAARRREQREAARAARQAKEQAAAKEPRPEKASKKKEKPVAQPAAAPADDPFGDILQAPADGGGGDGPLSDPYIPTIGNPAAATTPDDGDVAMVIEAPELEQAEGEEELEDTREGSLDTRYDPRADLSHFRFPPLDLLNDLGDAEGGVDAAEQEENKQRIIKTLNDFGIPISSIKATIGPTVTLYEIVPAEGVRIAKVKHLEDDIALSLAALGIRIIAPIPGKGTIGIEVPNKDPQTVSIRSILGSKAYAESKMALPMAMGCTISNEVFMADLTKMPHLLVAGATGMGKSVGLNAIIASLLYKKHPAELKFVLVDPKQVEFSLYAKLERHYLAKLPDEEEAIVTRPEKVLATLNSLCVEMDDRYSLLKNAGCRTVKEYNDKFVARRLNPEKGHRYLPYIVVIVDEFGDLIMTAGKDVEKPIARIAQKARAVGMHMILATQRPSTNVITGVIKANFPGRVAFRVFQMVDSRTILDRPGANQLIGRGDMLFSNSGNIERVQCAFIDTPEVDAICDFIDGQPGYDHAYLLPEYVPESDGDAAAMANLNDRDTLFEEAARFVVQSNTASTSSLQRRYGIGYNRAGKIMDQMEAAGIVGPAAGGKPRQVLLDSLSLERLLEQ